MKTEIRNIFINNDKMINLNELLKEKILYDNICNKHDFTYSKYCSTCNKDLCANCDKEFHLEHNIINYDSFLPDKNEINSAIKNVKLYENDNNIFMNEINLWEKQFNNIKNEYMKKVKDIIAFLKDFNFEKMNFNLIYKYRLVLDLFSEYDYSKDINGKNKKQISNMESYLKEKEKLNIKNDCQWISNNINKLKEFSKYIKSKNSFSNVITKIIDIIDIKYNNNKPKKSNNHIDKKVLEDIEEITPYSINKIRTSSSAENIK